MKAAILFSHGSLLCGSGEALDGHARRLQEMGEWDMVEVGYLNYSVPMFADTVAKCHAAGATSIVVVPYFLVPGYFVNKSLPEQVRTVQAEYPDLDFRIAEPIGFDERLADALLESALDPMPPSEWRGDFAAAARNCRANSQCPLYGTLDCPRAPEPGGPVRLFVE